MVTEQEPGTIVWHNGKLIPWQDANIHVMSHVVNYGSSVFEGIRCYDTKIGSAVFKTRCAYRAIVQLGTHLSNANPIYI